MNLGVTIRKLLRRWYILLPGLLLAVAGVVGVWLTVPAQYERTSTQLLLPGQGSLPLGTGNPYLYIGGLSLAADVVVRASGTENLAREVAEDHPGVSFQVSRDPSTAGPVIRTTVSAPNDEEAGVVLERLTLHTSTVLGELQDMESIPKSERITVVTVTVDDQGIVRDRARLILSAGTGVAIGGFSVFLAALVEGIAAWRRSRRAALPTRAPSGTTEDPTPVIDEEPPADAELSLEDSELVEAECTVDEQPPTDTPEEVTDSLSYASDLEAQGESPSPLIDSQPSQ